ncbi:phospholipase, partial [Bacillus mycoides]|nr:phospholipase [Bacillus mycoides]
DLRHLDKESKYRTITIPTGIITSNNFKLTKEEKEWLYNSGYNEANKFLQSWNFRQYVYEYRDGNQYRKTNRYFSQLDS